ncbi:hypothetical protein [Kribbella sp. CA-294648]|uniref:hypothetical protein n=1 Tax=Kribbella sp. CA-294648 TaxID=3239948 RepID=UPI003D9450A4
MRRLLAGLTVLAAAGVGVIAPATGAEAVVNPLRNLELTQSTGYAGVSEAYCSVGKVVIGGSFRSSPGVSTTSRLGTFKPVSKVNAEGHLVYGFRVSASRQYVTATTPPITVKALCADWVHGYEIVQRWGFKNAVWEKTSKATCPAGKVVIGSGVEATGGNVSVDEVLPSTNQVGVKAFGKPGSSVAWELGAYAICSYPLINRSVVNTGVGTVDSTGKAEGRSLCPYGTNVLSAGFDLIESLGRAGMYEAFFDQVGSRTGVSVRAVQAVYPSATWRTAAYAVCAEW